MDVLGSAIRNTSALVTMFQGMDRAQLPAAVRYQVDDLALDLRCDVREALPRILDGDRELVRQVLDPERGMMGLPEDVLGLVLDLAHRLEEFQAVAG